MISPSRTALLRAWAWAYFFFSSIVSCAGSFALTGAHEIGHLAGLGHDTADPRSIMNVTEGAGLRETQAFFIPSHAEVLERVLGRWKEPKK